ncbi:MAG: HEAT repeat domain-containing protein [Deltaproteobacteria bacterium]|nr:HEAT repeat domain-containing protein [Deltaproteobacteria bacterium]
MTKYRYWLSDSCMRLVYVLTIIGAVTTLLVDGPGWAQDVATSRGGVSVTLAFGKLMVKRDGRVLQEVAMDDQNDAETVTLAENARGEIVFSVLTAGPSPRRGVGVVKGESVTIVWDAPLTYIGDPGEETATDVRLLDLDGDRKPEIVKGTLYVPTRLCGETAPPLLFREKWDYKKKKFVQASGPRLPMPDTTLAPSADFVSQTLLGLRFLVPTGVSSAAGDDRNPLLTTPPFALTDGQPETGWTTDADRVDGEFASFLTLADWKINAVGVNVASSQRDAQKGERFAIPSTLVVSFENVAYRLAIPQTDGMHWFELPQPVSSNCLSVIIGNTGSKAKAPVSLFELQVQTEMHQPGGLKKLAALLDDDDEGERTLNILRSVGVSAFDAIRAHWKSFGPAGKRRAVRLISEIAPEKGAHLLVSYGVTDGRYVHAELMQGLVRSGGAGETALEKYLSDKSVQKYRAALKLLVELGSEAAFDRLLSAWQRVDDSRKKAVLQGVSTLARGSASRAGKVLELATAAKVKGELKVMFDLLRICVVNAATAEDAALLAREVYDDADFENRYRALRIIGTSKVEMSVQFMAEVAQGDNRFLRQLAAKALGQFGSDEIARNALIAMAQDTEPAVQIEAMNSLLNVASEKKQKAVDVAMESTWPEVRTLAVKNAADLPRDRQRLVAAGLQDKNYMVVLAALSLAADMTGKNIDDAVTGILTGSNNAKLLVRAAEVAGARCQRDIDTLAALNDRLRIGAEPLANSTEKIIAVAAAKALGRIGSPTAVKYLKTVREHSNLTTDRAIDDALVKDESGCKGE